MGFFSVKAESAEVVAREVTYSPGLNTQKLHRFFKGQNVFAKKPLVEAYTALTGTSTGTPQPGEVFQLEKSVNTSHGTIPAGEPGLVVADAERPDIYQVAIPARTTFLGTSSLILTEVRVGQSDVENLDIRESTLAVGRALVQLAQGNIHNPGGGE
jgi:hypothetical protein